MPVRLVAIHAGFSDATRLRMLQLLRSGPLCVSHFQAILGIYQVKASKQLAYLRDLGLLDYRRLGNRRVYSLPDPLPADLAAELDCLQLSSGGYPVFARDATARAQLAPAIRAALASPVPVPRGGPARSAIPAPALPASLFPGDAGYVD